MKLLVRNTFHPASGDCAMTVDRKPYFGAATAALPAFVAVGTGMPGMPGSADVGALSGVAPKADANVLLGVAIVVHAGGSDS